MIPWSNGPYPDSGLFDSYSREYFLQKEDQYSVSLVYWNHCTAWMGDSTPCNWNTPVWNGDISHQLPYRDKSRTSLYLSHP